MAAAASVYRVRAPTSASVLVYLGETAANTVSCLPLITITIAITIIILMMSFFHKTASILTKNVLYTINDWFE